MIRLLPFWIVLLLLLKVGFVKSQEAMFNRVESPLRNFSGIVGGITQDNNGYMWIATSGGLYKYDGYRFRLYTNDPANANSLTSSRLETVYADRKGMIWIATWAEGVDRLDPATGIFMHFRHNPNEAGSLSNDTVRSILEDRDGTLWLGTASGLDRYNPKTNKFYNYWHNPNDPNSLSCNRVRKIYEDREGTLWVATGSVWVNEGGGTDEGGLNRFDKRTGKFVRYLHDPKNPRSLLNNKVQGICEDSQGTFWVGTAGDGLHTMNRRTGTFERHRYDPAHPEKLSRPPLRGTGGFDHITSIIEDAVGNIWIGTLENGINRYDPKTGKTTHYSNKDTAIGFTDNSGWTFYNSRDGILWIGTWQGGLFRIDPYHKNIPHITIGSNVGAFLEDSAGSFWIGSGEGLILRDKITGASKTFMHDPLNPASLSNNFIRSLFRDREGTLWIGTSNGLNRFNPQFNAFTRYVNNPDEPNSIGIGEIYAIEDAGGDSLWVGTDNGLDRMHKRTGACTHFRNNPKDINSITSNDIGAMLRDNSGNLWVGAFPGRGLNYLNRTTGQFKHFFKGISIISLCRDAAGILWVGTDVAGVYRSNKNGNGFTKFTAPGSGMENAPVLSIQEDDQKNIWLRTETDIYRINPQTGQTTVFGARYGINTGNLNYNAGYKGRNGEIYFGAVDGYYVLSPDELLTNPTPPQVVLTDLRIGGKSVIPGKGRPLNTILEQAKKISLDYHQNAFVIDFAAVHYGSPEQNRHLYKLENYDPDWREAGVEKTAFYYNVPPGRYVFKVRAASGEGVWAEKAVSIIIHPPWWRTWWAYCVYGILFIVGIYVIHRYLKQRVISAERERTRVRELAQAKEIEKAYKELGIKSMQLEQQKEELQATLEDLRTTQTQLVQREKMASLGELTAGIAHEIQNPLNFVNNFSEVNTDLIAELRQEADKGNMAEVKAIAGDIEQNEQKINHHGRRADAIVKGMLQHSRASTGKKEPTDINALADEYLRLSYHGLRAKVKDFNATFTTRFDESIGKIEVVPQEIGRVLLNLYNNAFYSVSEKKKAPTLKGENYEPTVWVTTKRISTPSGAGGVEISVRDNGNGVPQKVLDKIFQPFFTTKPTGQGTGLGLSLSYDIIKAHGGEIKVETKEGEGAEFIVQLPVINN